MKQLFILFVLLSFSFQLMAQNTTKIFINNKKVAEAIVNPDKQEAILLIKKLKYKKYNPFIIAVSGEDVGSGLYRRSLEISGEKSIIIKETKNKPGHFDISKSGIAKSLLAGKNIPLYLLLNPSNPLMAMPSKRVFLGNVVMKW